MHTPHKLNVAATYCIILSLDFGCLSSCHYSSQFTTVVVEERGGRCAWYLVLKLKNLRTATVEFEF
jgi:hypothetical protein